MPIEMSIVSWRICWSARRLQLDLALGVAHQPGRLGPRLLLQLFPEPLGVGPAPRDDLRGLGARLREQLRRLAVELLELLLRLPRIVERLADRLRGLRAPSAAAATRTSRAAPPGSET